MEEEIDLVGLTSQSNNSNKQLYVLEWRSTPDEDFLTYLGLIADNQIDENGDISSASGEFRKISKEFDLNDSTVLFDGQTRYIYPDEPINIRLSLTKEDNADNLRFVPIDEKVETYNIKVGELFVYFQPNPNIFDISSIDNTGAADAEEFTITDDNGDPNPEEPEQPVNTQGFLKVKDVDGYFLSGLGDSLGRIFDGNYASDASVALQVKCDVETNRFETLDGTVLYLYFVFDTGYIFSPGIISDGPPLTEIVSTGVSGEYVIVIPNDNPANTGYMTSDPNQTTGLGISNEINLALKFEVVPEITQN